MCLRPGAKMRDRMLTPPPGALDAVFTSEDIDYYVEAFERSGITPPLNYYRSLELDWELLGGYEGRPLHLRRLDGRAASGLDDDLVGLAGGGRVMLGQQADRGLGIGARQAQAGVEGAVGGAGGTERYD
jgi:hypothetical protein